MLKKYIKIFLNRNQRRLYILLILLSILSIFFELLSLSSLIPLFGFLIDSNLFLEKLSIIFNQNLINTIEIFIKQDFTIFLLLLCGIILFTFIVKNLFLAITQYLKLKFLKNLQIDLSTKFYTNYLNSDYNFYIKRNSSDIVRNIDREIPNLIAYLNIVVLIIQDFSIIIATSIILSLINFKIFCSVFVILFIFSFSYFKYFKKKITIAGRVRQENQKKFIQSIFESFSLKNYIMIENLLPFFKKKFYNFSNFLYESQLKKSVIIMLSRYLLEIFLIIVIISILLLLYYDTNNLKLTQFSMGIIFLCIFRLAPPFNRIITSLNSLKYIHISLDLLGKENRKIGKLIYKEKKLSKKTNFQSLHLKNISFNYNKSKNKIDLISNINLHIKKGDKVCIIGETGSGKSTLINLILGILKPNNGKIVLNNKLNSELYNSAHVSYVPQKIYLLDSSIKNNIILGSIKNYNLFIETIELTNLKNFIRNLNKKENTIIGEDAKKISVGQKQRIGIARAIYKKFDFLILDEATSSLDEETEKNVLKKLMSKFKHKTILCITHRLSNLKLFDKAYEISRGDLKKVNLK